MDEKENLSNKDNPNEADLDNVDLPDHSESMEDRFLAAMDDDDRASSIEAAQTLSHSQGG